jgi:rare lipoprotein A
LRPLRAQRAQIVRSNVVRSNLGIPSASGNRALRFSNENILNVLRRRYLLIKMMPRKTQLQCSSLRALPALFILCLLVAGCSHRHVQAPAPPPPPAEEQPPAESVPPPPAPEAPRHGGKVIYSQVGMASWYGSPYHNRRSADGKIYNQDGMTAAHRTLPFGTVVRVTNLATRQSAVLTITDRGPFVPNRMIDLSRAAAIKTGVYRTGVAKVRMDVLRSPQAIGAGGRWCVQIGVFRHSSSAIRLRNHLQHEFPDANVIEFTGPTGHWVRIRPSGEAHRAAVDIARSLHPAEGQAYVVRLD